MIGAAALITMSSTIGKSLGGGSDNGTALHLLQVRAGRFACAAMFAVVTLMRSWRHSSAIRPSLRRPTKTTLILS